MIQMFNQSGPGYQVCVFDWDGTLVDSERHIVNSLSYAAERMGLPALGYDELKDIIGLSMQKALARLYPDLSDNDINLMRSHYGEFFFSVAQDQTTLFSHVPETLTRLQHAGVKLAVATGKSRHGLDKALQSTGLKSFFDIERCADETASKPDPLMLQQIADYFRVPPGSMLMVGDTEYDLEMAGRIKMDAVGVSYGVHDKARLERHSPIAVIDCISQLLEHVV
jgi:phosphoglycolate phosphatase